MTAYVEGGGRLVVTGESSLYDEWGDRRDDFALAELLGVHHEGKRFESGKVDWETYDAHTYLRIEDRGIAGGFDGTDVLPFGGQLEVVRASRPAVTYVPPFPIYPPEKSWMAEPRTDVPAVVLGERTAYLAADLDRLYAQYHHPDHGRLLANLVRWAARDDIPLRSRAPAYSTASSTGRATRIVLHLVNLDQGGAWRGGWRSSRRPGRSPSGSVRPAPGSVPGRRRGGGGERAGRLDYGRGRAHHRSRSRGSQLRSLCARRHRADERAVRRDPHRAALGLIEQLHREYDGRRQELLERRRERVAEIAAGASLGFLPETTDVRDDPDWRVGRPAPGLVDRRVEITGPTDRKMTINALNSGAKVWLADQEDANTPLWENVIGGQLNLLDAITRRIDFSTDAKSYELKPDEELATIVVRPRGWHLPEKHIQVDGSPVSGSLVDFALYLAACGQLQIDRGQGPYFYLPKMESHLEARLWNDVFVLAQEYLGIPRGTIRATVLIETYPAAFEMEEILYELREHSAGLNAGRWDFMFSVIKTYRTRGTDFQLPDRNTSR